MNSFDIDDDEHNHKLSSASWKYYDNKSENELLEALKGFNYFRGQDTSEYLRNIATKYLATNAISESRLNPKQIGQQEVDKLVDRLIQAPTQFNYPIRKHKPPTFKDLYIVDNEKGFKDKHNVQKGDRDVMQRLVTAYEAKQSVDSENVFTHELMPVPVSIA